MSNNKVPVIKEISTYSQNTFEGGINLNSETAQPNQVADSRNMWSPVNMVESRPGIRFLGMPIQSETTNGAGTCIALNSSVYSSPFATTSPNFNGANGDILYFKYTPDVNTTIYDWSGVKFTATAQNANEAAMRWEYWNGEAWVDLQVMPTANLSSTLSRFDYNTFFLKDIDLTNNYVKWKMPGNVSTTTVNGNTGYSVRMRIVNASSSVTLTGASSITLLQSYTLNNNKRYYADLRAIYWAGGGNTYLKFMQDGGTATTQSILVSSNLAEYHGPYNQAMNYAAPSGYRFPYREFDLTTLPEYNTAFYAIDGLVVSIEKNKLNAANTTLAVIDYAAQVEDDTNIVGETKDLSKTFIPQESTYPHSSYVLWINSFLFHARTQDNPYIVRWSAPSSFALKGFKVWPKTSQTTVLGDDLSPIVGMKAFGEHPIVLKRHSMWRMVYVGPGDDGLGIWEAAKLSGGVGTIANSSVQITPAGMVHAYEDGLYVFDGVKSTKIGSDKIQEFWNQNVNITTTAAFVSGHWKSKHCYLLSIPTKDRAGKANNKVLVWDYVNDAFWIWDNLDVTSFHCDTVNNTVDEMYFTSSDSSIYQFTGNSDNGTAIDSYITTHRFGYKDNTTKQARQVYIGSTPESGEVLTSVITNDRDIYSSGTMVFTDPKEPAAGTLLWNQGIFTSTTKRRFRHLNFRERGKWFQVKARHTVNNKPFKLVQLQLGVYTSVAKIR